MTSISINFPSVRILVFSFSSSASAFIAFLGISPLQNIFSVCLNCLPTKQYMKTFAELKEEMKFMKDMFTEPVDGEEEMVDADGDRIPA